MHTHGVVYICVVQSWLYVVCSVLVISNRVNCLFAVSHVQIKTIHISNFDTPSIKRVDEKKMRKRNQHKTALWASEYWWTFKTKYVYVKRHSVDEVGEFDSDTVSSICKCEMECMCMSICALKTQWFSCRFSIIEMCHKINLVRWALLPFCYFG